MTERPWTVAVLGPGGVGGLLATLLARAGHRVICLAGEETAQALRDGGLRLRSPQYGEFAVAVEAATELREPADLLLVTVKETALEPALERVSPEVLGDGLVVPLLNGADHPAVLRRRYRPELVVTGAIRVESTRVAPGVIEHGSSFTKVDLAGDTAPRGRVDELAAVLDGAGVDTAVRDSEGAVLWSKLALLAPFALLTTRYGVPIGEMRTTHREDLTALLGETTALGRAEGAGADVSVEGLLPLYDGFAPEAKSSMLRDAEAGRPLELDAIGHALIRAGERHGIAVPVATRLVAELESTSQSVHGTELH
jgi:2-dehydropantoate 2-reductase